MDYAKKNGYLHPKYFVDDGISGTTFDRPGFREMEALIEAGQVAAVIVKDLSRFGREHVETSRYLEIIYPTLGVKFVAIQERVDTETGEVTLLDYAAAVDCGTPINPNLTRVQAEGGIAQGIGMTLTESVTYDDRGYPMENSLFQYKIPARVDIGKIRVEFENSYEGEGPFGAKSIGEVVINTPLPAISDAIRNAVGKRFYELPITPEKIAMAALEKK